MMKKIFVTLFLKRIFKDSQSFFILAIIIVLLVNTTSIRQEIIRNQRNQPPFEQFFLNTDLSKITDNLKGITHIGYYTDVNILEKKASARFSQTQYLLVPTILVPGNYAYEYILLDGTNPLKTLLKLKELKAKPVVMSEHGFILARKKQ